MNKRGSIIFCVLLVLILSTLSAALLLRSVNENKLARRAANSSAALWAAEAGLNKVLWESNYNLCQGMVQSGTNTACVNCTTCGSKSVAGTLSGYGDYDATLDAANTVVQSVGSVTSRSATDKVQRRIQAAVSRPSIFSYGMYAQGQITVANNALVDSYISANGNYGGMNIRSNGDVGSNGTTAGVINISNNATVKGDVSTGPSGTVTLGGNATVTGTTTHANSVPLPAVVVPTTMTSLSSSGSLNINGTTTTMNSGSYKYSSIAISNNGTLTVNGNVRLYLTSASGINSGNNATINIADGASLTIYTDGVVTLSNNCVINNVSKSPASLLIYSTYTGANGVTVNNNGTTYASVYAPKTDVDLSNNSGFFGAVVGKTVDLSNNGSVHYDESLATMANPFETSILSNWQEY